MVLVAPALPTNEPGGPPSRRSLSWQLRMAYSRALLQVPRVLMGADGRPCIAVLIRGCSFLYRFAFISRSLKLQIKNSSLMKPRHSMGHGFAQLDSCLLQTEGPALHYVRGTLLKKAEEVRGGDLSGVFHDITRATPVRRPGAARGVLVLP